MRKIIACGAVLFLALTAFVTHRLSANAAPKALGRAELLALMAGNALPEDVVDAINAYGLSFRPDDTYVSLLKTAGGDATIVAALKSAKIIGSIGHPGQESGHDYLEHIANAGAFIRDQHYDQAGKEVTAALKISSNDIACGFVMGEVLREEQQWEQAQAVYARVLDEDSAFPEAHAKLSFILYKLQDPQGALEEAKAALVLNPNDPEAHKNAGLAYDQLHQWSASLAEYDAALRIKPNYEFVQADMAVLYYNEGDWSKAIAQFKKASAVVPVDANTAYYMGYTYDQLHDPDSAIREYRKSKELDPNRYDARQNLGSDLLQTNQPAEAAEEFRELVSMSPSAGMAHDGLGAALWATNDDAGAEKEWRTAEQLDPSDPYAHGGVGQALERQKKYDDALGEYRQVVQLAPTMQEAWLGIGRILIAQQKYSDAATQLQHAEMFRPDVAELHDLRAQAMTASGDLAGAILEFQASLQLDARQTSVMLRLASAFEKKGDWVSSLNEYHEASLTDSSIDLRTKIVPLNAPNPQKEYQLALQRWKAHLATLRAAGKSSEAATLEAKLRAAQAAPSLSDQVDAALQSGWSAALRRDTHGAIAQYKSAVDLAEKLPANDPRLVTALDNLGNCYFGWNNPAAQAAYERELQVSIKKFGPESPNLTNPLQALGRTAMIQRDYSTAEKFYFQAVDVNEKAFGESSDRVANSLVEASAVFVIQKQYAKAEPYVLRAVHIDEALFGSDGKDSYPPVADLCRLYDDWEKAGQVDACDHHLLAILQKQYGPDSPLLVNVLVDDSKQLHALGRTADADAVDRRIASIRAATMKPN
jgi:tetratricopeptide (TPR) repeat protein